MSAPLVTMEGIVSGLIGLLNKPLHARLRVLRVFRSVVFLY